MTRTKEAMTKKMLVPNTSDPDCTCCDNEIIHPFISPIKTLKNNPTSKITKVFESKSPIYCVKTFLVDLNIKSQKTIGAVITSSVCVKVVTTKIANVGATAITNPT